MKKLRAFCLVTSLTIGYVPRAALTSLFLKRKVYKPPHVLVLCDFFLHLC